MARKRRTRDQLVVIIRRQFAVIAFLVVVLIAHPGLLVGLVLAAATVGLSFAYGRFSARGKPNARSLAQRNRHLEKQLNAYQVKLEREMDKA